MEKQLKCVLLLSLKEMALRRVVVLFCSRQDIFASIRKLRSGEYYHEGLKEWRAINGDAIKKRMGKLKLPESITKQLIDVVKPISLEIKGWKHAHDALFSSMNKIGLIDSVKLCWTSAGAVDYQKTAEELVRADVFNVIQRYKIACSYCLEDHIPQLWEEFPESFRRSFKNIVHALGGEDLTFIWHHILKGKISKLDYLWKTGDGNLSSFNQYAFECSAKNYRKSAAEYFFQKLTVEERATSLLRIANHALQSIFFADREHYRDKRASDIVCYLLSFMTPAQQMETVKAHPTEFFSCLLDWPWQDLFLENAELIWTLISPHSYYRLMYTMTARFRDPDYYHPKFFEAFFMHSPLDFKTYFIDQKHAITYLSMFFGLQDSESVRVIFRNLDAAHRMRLLMTPDVFRLFCTSLLTPKCPLVEVCLREAELSREDGQRLREAYVAYIRRNYSGDSDWQNRNLRRFFTLLDEADMGADKGKKAVKRKLEG